MFNHFDFPSKLVRIVDTCVFWDLEGKNEWFRGHDNVVILCHRKIKSFKISRNKKNSWPNFLFYEILMMVKTEALRASSQKQRFLATKPNEADRRRFYTPIWKTSKYSNLRSVFTRASTNRKQFPVSKKKKNTQKFKDVFYFFSSENYRSHKS